jgi:ribosomal subunit interface protein
MLYNLKGTNISLTDEIRDYLEKKLATLDKLTDAEGARADVEIEYMKDEARMYRAEAMLIGTHLKSPFRAEVRGATLHESVDLMTHELAAELTRAKKKHIHSVRKGAAAIKDFVRGFGRGN